MPAKKHDFTKTEIKAGLMVLLSGLALAAFVVTILGAQPTANTASYYAKFTNANGLQLGADVFYGGVEVGRVIGVGPDPEDQAQICVEVSLPLDVPVNAGSVATIEQIGLTAPKHLEISTGTTDAPKLSSGAELASETKSGGLIELPDLDGVVDRAETLLDDVITFLGVAEAVAAAESGDQEVTSMMDVASDLQGTLKEATGLVGDVRGLVEEEAPNIDEILRKVAEIGDSVIEITDSLAAILEENRGPVRNILADAEEAMASIGDVVDLTASELEGLLATLDRTTGSAEATMANVEDFLNENRASIEDVIEDLRRTTRNLSSLTRTLSEQPQSLIRGAPQSGRK